MEIFSQATSPSVHEKHLMEMNESEATGSYSFSSLLPWRRARELVQLSYLGDSSIHLKHCTEWEMLTPASCLYNHSLNKLWKADTVSHGKSEQECQGLGLWGICFDTNDLLNLKANAKSFADNIAFSLIYASEDKPMTMARLECPFKWSCSMEKVASQICTKENPLHVDL